MTTDSPNGVRPFRNKVDIASRSNPAGPGPHRLLRFEISTLAGGVLSSDFHCAVCHEVARTGRQPVIWVAWQAAIDMSAVDR